MRFSRVGRGVVGAVIGSGALPRYMIATLIHPVPRLTIKNRHMSRNSLNFQIVHSDPDPISTKSTKSSKSITKGSRFKVEALNAYTLSVGSSPSSHLVNG